MAGAYDGVEVDTAWFVRGNNCKQPDPVFSSNAEETDTRLWLHARKTSCANILIMSPDTDVYHIGLPLKCVTQKEIIVQVNAVNSRQLRLLNLTALVQALCNDPDLAHINPSLRPQILQTLFVVSGCDYISFFSRLGKATFLRYFYQYASFISSGDETTPGTLADTALQDEVYQQGYLSFIRLIGTVYFKKHSSGFETPSPVAHFKKFSDPSLTVQQQHSRWLEDIRQNIWDRTAFENEMIPSDEALLLHWKRSCWVVHMWQQADRNTMTLEPITQCGWSLNNGELTVIWDSESNVTAVRQRVTSLLRGCRCTTGCTGLCGCRRKKIQCSIGCQCINCSNTEEVIQQDEMAEIALEEESYTTDIEVHDTEDIIDQIFGKGEGREVSEIDETDSSDSEDL